MMCISSRSTLTKMVFRCSERWGSKSYAHTIAKDTTLPVPMRKLLFLLLLCFVLTYMSEAVTIPPNKTPDFPITDSATAPPQFYESDCLYLVATDGVHRPAAHILQPQAEYTGLNSAPIPATSGDSCAGGQLPHSIVGW